MTDNETLRARVTRIVGSLNSPFKSSRVAFLATDEYDSLRVIRDNTIATLKQMPCVTRINRGTAFNSSDWEVSFGPGEKCIERKCKFAKVERKTGKTRCSRIMKGNQYLNNLHPFWTFDA